MSFTLNQLRCFCQVAHQGQYTRAAEALYVSQPAVSKSIKDLERQLGLPLFERAGREVRLTAPGRLLLERAERILAESAAAERMLRAVREGEQGTLLIGASSTPGTYLLPRILGAFRHANPKADLSVEIAATGEVLRRLAAGLLDLALVGETDFSPDLEAEVLETEELVLIMPAGHPLTTKRAIRGSDLAEQPLILREPGSSTRQVLLRALTEAGVAPRVSMELGSTEAVKNMVAAGLGVSMVSEHAIRLEEAAGTLICRKTTPLNTRRGIYLVRRRSLRPAALLERLLHYIRRR